MARVLIFDSETQTAGLLRQVLEARGHAVHVSGSEREGWRMACDRGGGELAIAELMLAEGSGLGLLERLAADPLLGGMPLSVFTREKKRAPIAAALKLGVRNVLIKPAKPSQILAEVARAERTDWRAALFEPIAAACARAGILRDEYPSLLHACLEAAIQAEVALRGTDGPAQRRERARTLQTLHARARQIGFQALARLGGELGDATNGGDLAALQRLLARLRLAIKILEDRRASLPFSALWVPRRPREDEDDGKGGEAIVDVIPAREAAPQRPARVRESEAEPRAAPEATATIASEAPGDEALATIATGRAFPAFDAVAEAIHNLLAQDDLDLGNVAAWIRRDAGLSARVLSMANSAYIAPAYPVEDVAMAIQLLGTRRVQVMASSLREGAELNKLFTGYDWQAFWSHSVGCAMVAEDILECLNAPALPGVYLAGLIHDTGKILLSQRYAESYKEALATALKEGRPLIEVETERFETNHEELGAFHAEQHGLPEPFPSVMRHHGRPDEAPEAHQPAVAVVSVANWLCKRHGLGFSGAVLPGEHPTLHGHPGWAILKAWAQPLFEVERFERLMERRIARARYELHCIARELGT